MKLVIIHPRWSGNHTRFEVFSPDSAETRSVVDRPDGARWGCLNFDQPAAALQAVQSALPDATDLQWHGAVLLGIWHGADLELAARDVAREEAREAFDRVKEADARLWSAAAPRLVGDDGAVETSQEAGHAADHEDPTRLRLVRAMNLAATRARDYAANLSIIREVEDDPGERARLNADIKTALDDAERLDLIAKSYGAT